MDDGVRLHEAVPEAFAFVPAEPAHLRRMAEIHASELADGFLPQFGVGFMRMLYSAMFGSQAARGLVALHDGEPVAFSSYTLDHRTFFRRTLWHGSWKLAFYAGLGLLRRPSLLRGIVATLRYDAVADVVGVTAEFHALAVDRRWRNRHLGARLLDATEKRLRAEGVRVYKHTVYADNVTANDLYRRRGHVQVGTFRLYGRAWGVFRVDLGKPGSSA